MARPRIIKLEDGEIKLQGFSKERADALANLLTSKEETKDDFTIVDSFQIEEEIDCKEIAVGLRENKEQKQWELVTVCYDYETGVAKITAVEPAGTTRNVAQSKFRTTVVMKGLIK